MSEEDVRFSGAPNTMIAMAFVTATLALAISMWGLSRIGELEAFVAVQAVKSAQQ